MVHGGVPGGDTDLTLAHDPGLLAVQVEPDLLIGLRTVDDLAVLVVRRLASRAGGQSTGAPVVLGAHAIGSRSTVERVGKLAAPVDIGHDVGLADAGPVVVVPAVCGTGGAEAR